MLSIFYAHLVQAAQEKTLPMTSILSMVKDMGIDAVELDADEIKDAEQLFRELADTGLSVTSLYAVYNWARHPENMKAMRQVRLAEQLHAHRIMPIPGFFSGESMQDPKRKKAELDNMLSGMRKLSAYAHARGIQVTIEDYDHPLSPIATIRGMQVFLDAVPTLTVTLDTGNFLFSGENVLDAFEVFRSRIAHVHLKDRFLRGDLPVEAAKMRFGEPCVSLQGMELYPCAVGEGVIPMKQVLMRLEKTGYTGDMTIEHFGASRQWDCIQSSAQYLRKWNRERCEST